jgi:Fe-S cluster assembly ATP-binding protein
MAALLITHWQRILKEVQPDVVHVMLDGRIVESGDYSLAARLEAEGYDAWRR